MITYQEAIRIVDDHTPVLASKHATNPSFRVLARDLVAEIDSPPFSNSAVDGYGRRSEDLESSALHLVGEVSAGAGSPARVEPGTCIRIFTGAPIPPDVSAVTMQEDCTREGGRVRFSTKATPGEHIRAAGSDFRRGDILLSRGTWLTPPAAALAASAGQTKIACIPWPRATLLTTGNELVDPGQPLAPGQIYDSNAVGLGQALRAVTESTRVQRCPDDPETTRGMVAEALRSSDVLLTCGGVSVGDYDFLKEAFAACGVEPRFWQVALKPGKPLYFGTKGRSLVFGLPGNPVSALVTYVLFARPALLKMAGHPDPWGATVSARLEGEVHKKAGRLEFLRGIFSEGVCRPVVGQGSHQLADLATANCLIHFPLASTVLRSGDEVEVTLLDWSFPAPGATGMPWPR